MGLILLLHAPFNHTSKLRKKKLYILTNRFYKLKDSFCIDYSSYSYLYGLKRTKVYFFKGINKLYFHETFWPIWFSPPFLQVFQVDSTMVYSFLAESRKQKDKHLVLCLKAQTVKINNYTIFTWKSLLCYFSPEIVFFWSFFFISYKLQFEFFIACRKCH